MTVFLDFQKAFDLVNHQLLCFKLGKLNIDPNILSWIESFLRNRTQFVTANNADSSPCSVTSGMPQGSVLGPLLFLIYINDLPISINSTIRLFADDCVIYRVIKSASDSSLLQSDLNKVSSWCNIWLMRLNTNKCKVMRISHRSANENLIPYNISGSLLEQVTTYKYLGIDITANLSWQAHIDYIVNNANRMLGYLRRNFSMAPSSLKLLLYKTLVRSKLEYACSVWDPGLETLTNQLESVQNRSARFILSNFSRTASVTTMKNTLNLPSLSLRRKLARILTFQKIYYHNYHLNRDLLFEPSFISPRTDHRHKVRIPYCRSNAYFNSFIPKTASDWNHLPTLVADISDTCLFKNAAENYVFD